MLKGGIGGNTTLTGLNFEKKVDYIVLCEYCHKKYHDNIPEVLDVIDEKWREQKEMREKRYNNTGDKNEKNTG